MERSYFLIQIVPFKLVPEAPTEVTFKRGYIENQFSTCLETYDR